ncbi:response regulator [Mesorhizobium sp. B2-3-4]|uniref:response regulator n=1 Tax=Mesorhizobium sp. B2-3-4 TaxID=2589959 RepID=UPI001126BCB6|nr:response regulator [Mesorhizobium sp. B2-3-4]TPM29979.1 response regulator [Mesorhizobium sp. B2-3-4]
MRKPLALIVEDEAFIVADLEASLKRAGFAVSAAASCERTREILSYLQPDIAILDIILRDCDSGEIAEQLALRQIPFLVYSGTDLDGRSEAFKAGKFVGKPANTSELVRLAVSLTAR